MRFCLMILVAAVLSFSPSMADLRQAQRESPAQSSTPDDEARIAMEKSMVKQANLQRQAELRRDADRLLKLATELKQSVDKSSESTLSVDVIKKAAEIEKLARSVKDKMKGN